ncbi:MAG: hypothetical protein J6L96_04715 [Clostridia bacterium]|nr:hypothetical protein [Clostridia bacterium]
MARNKNNFLDFLSGTGNTNVIFEPLMSKTSSEVLIWRRGKKLWSSPAEYIRTLASVTERIDSDFFFADMRLFTDEQKDSLLEAAAEIKEADDKVGVGFICDCKEDVDLASSVADCLCIYGDATSDSIPVIRMNGNIEDAISRGDSGWFAQDNAAHYLEAFGDRIKIMGGLGVEFVKNSSPKKIHSVVGKLAAQYRGKWACGSGGVIPKENYYELTSMLGAYSKIR